MNSREAKCYTVSCIEFFWIDQLMTWSLDQVNSCKRLSVITAPVLHACLRHSHDGIHTTQYSYSPIIKLWICSVIITLNWVESVVKSYFILSCRSVFHIRNSKCCDFKKERRSRMPNAMREKHSIWAHKNSISAIILGQSFGHYSSHWRSWLRRTEDTTRSVVWREKQR